MRTLSARLRSLDLGVFTWAGLQSAYANGGGALAALQTGTRAFVSDWNALFTPNAAKTQWVPVNKLQQIASGAGSVASPIATFTGATSGQFSLPGGDPVLPANLCAAGWFVCLSFDMVKTTATATATLNWRLGTADTSSDGVLQSTNMPATSLPVLGNGESSIYSTTGRTRAGMIQGGSDSRIVGQTMSDITANVDFTAAQYLSVGIASANAADSFSLIRYALGVRAP